MLSNYLTLRQLLSPQELNQVLLLVNQATFQTGSKSASSDAASVKNNLQIRAEENAQAQQIGQIVMAAFSRSSLLQSVVMPKAILPPLVSIYRENMSYGTHVDSPLMGAQYTIRTDVGMTLFLSEPDTYEGGELRVITEAGEKTFKLNAGDAVLYPTTKLHEVRPVVSGTRIAVVTWMQSAIRDAHKREILFNLHSSINELTGENLHKERVKLQQVYSNLVRMWAEL